MNFCEKCNLLNKGESCIACGNKKLREVSKDDFCLFTECSQSLGKSFKNTLDNNGIPRALIPVGNGVRSLFGLRLENFKVYIPYEFWDKAEELYSLITGQTE